MTQFLIQASWLIPIYGLLGAVLVLPWATGAIRRTGPSSSCLYRAVNEYACLYSRDGRVQRHLE